VIMAKGSDEMVARMLAAARHAKTAPRLRLTRYSHSPAPNQPTDSGQPGPASQDGHDSWTRAYSDPSLFDWLFSQGPESPHFASKSPLLWAPGEHRIEMATAQKSPFDRRSFLFLVPQSLRFDPATGRVPTVVDFHGHSEAPWYQKLLLDIGAMSERYGWLIAIPFGTSDQYSPTCCPSSCPIEMCMKGLCLDKANACNWNSGPHSRGERRGADDVAFTRLLADWLLDPQSVGGDKQNLFGARPAVDPAEKLRLSD
jgi:hypothetical protein